MNKLDEIVEEVKQEIKDNLNYGEIADHINPSDVAEHINQADIVEEVAQYYGAEGIAEHVRQSHWKPTIPEYSPL